MLENFIFTDQFDAKNVHSEIIKEVPAGCHIEGPNVVILEPGKAPNCDDVCDMYYDELLISSNSNDSLYVACDQAIFARLTSYKEEHENVRLLLGQWHTNTSKDMCSTLITILAGYGIFNLATALP